jgi:hypothetical protein
VETNKKLPAHIFSVNFVYAMQKQSELCCLQIAGA